ncbi:prepilin-type N-terminal cleavage/methylation domain-containing protein [Ostreibacterium oceani]|nr:prepilin-type N-terminal cleavage/methylation domain-containing protein [Ostreibacterium oceani]
MQLIKKNNMPLASQPAIEVSSALQGTNVRSLSAQRGFTLLEVLFSLVIFAVGLLGYAALQVANTKRSSDALNQVWTQYHTRQLVDMMLSQPEAMQFGYFATQTRDAGGGVANGGFMRWGENLNFLQGVNNVAERQCYSAGNKNGVDPFQAVAPGLVDANSATASESCDYRRFAADYLHNMFAYNLARDLPNAAFKVECIDVDTTDATEKRCSKKGSRVNVTVVWSYDPNRQNIPLAGRGCYTGKNVTPVNGVTANFSLTGDECVQYSFFY